MNWTASAHRSCAPSAAPPTAGRARCARTSWPRPTRASPGGCATSPQAASAEQVAWEHAHAAGMRWQPVPVSPSSAPPYELRPGTGRRGPEDTWDRFDAAVAALNRAIGGSSAAVVADAFGDMAEIATALADAVAAEDANLQRGAA